MNFNCSPAPDLLPSFTDESNKIVSSIVSSISSQKDKLIFEVLKENNAPINDLTELVKQCRFIKQEGKNHQILNYNGHNILQINEPEITYEDGKFKVEIKYLKLY